MTDPSQADESGFQSLIKKETRERVFDAVKKHAKTEAGARSFTEAVIDEMIRARGEYDQLEALPLLPAKEVKKIRNFAKRMGRLQTEFDKLDEELKRCMRLSVPTSLFRSDGHDLINTNELSLDDRLRLVASAAHSIERDTEELTRGGGAAENDRATEAMIKACDLWKDATGLRPGFGRTAPIVQILNLIAKDLNDDNQFAALFGEARIEGRIRKKLERMKKSAV